MERMHVYVLTTVTEGTHTLSNGHEVNKYTSTWIDSSKRLKKQPGVLNNCNPGVK